MILNLKKLNMYAAKAHFKMDTLHTITKLMRIQATSGQTHAKFSE